MLVLKLSYQFGFNIGSSISNYIHHAFKSTYWKKNFMCPQLRQPLRNIQGPKESQGHVVKFH
jgi:hypothetical protein